MRLSTMLIIVAGFILPTQAAFAQSTDETTKTSTQPVAVSGGLPFDEILSELDDIDVVLADLAAAVQTNQGANQNIQAALDNLAVSVQANHDAILDVLDSVDLLGNHLTVQVAVNTLFCDSSPVQCSQEEIGFDVGDPAHDANRNPVELVVTISRGGVPVSGLELANFSHRSEAIPAGGPFLVLCIDECDDFIVGGESDEEGTYLLLVTTTPFFGPGRNWKEGFYASQIVVTDGDDKGTGLASFFIPNDLDL